MKRGREQWFDLQPVLEREQLVFIDETGTSTKMARRHEGSGAGLRRLMVIGTPQLLWAR